MPNLEKSNTSTSKIKLALISPFFILGNLIGISILLIVMFAVVSYANQLQNIFEVTSVNMPWPTIVFMTVANFFRIFWWLILIIWVILVLFLTLKIKRVK